MYNKLCALFSHKGIALEINAKHLWQTLELPFFMNSIDDISPLTVPTLGFQQTSYTFVEGNMEQVCITLDGFIEGPPLFYVILGYFPNTASKKIEITST